MWDKGWRDRAWNEIDQVWDVLIIGGGITGAGIFREACRAGLRVVLVEKDDFASGSSSRSSKLVHGGFRYLKDAQLLVTLRSVRQRERLLKEGPGLVSPLGFLIANYRGNPMPGWIFGLGLAAYDLFALKWGHRYYDAFDLKELCPPLCETGLQGGYRFFDAQTDDARLVLRVIREGVRRGGLALNYACVRELLRVKSGEVCGVILGDRSPEGEGRAVEVQARIVINATGAWADELRTQVGGAARLRKLRGSHLVFPSGRLPLSRAVSIQHPRDGRFVFAFPWEGVTLVGTTDIDHAEAAGADPSISSAELEYLLEAVDRVFPEQELRHEDIQCTFSGLRPVIDTGKADPSKEGRDHAIWWEEGLLTVTGGKLTTFRPMAHDALRAACKRLPGNRKFNPTWGVLDAPDSEIDIEAQARRLKPAARLRLLGRYGQDAPLLIESAQPGELDPIEQTPAVWAELRWAAKDEAVVHLDDLLLRRVRLGLLLPGGGLPLIDHIRPLVQAELGWDDLRWESEVQNYRKLWEQCYHIKDHEQRSYPGHRQRHAERQGAFI
jgi:glycerol-3-phosphate dehydrogenase